VVVTLGLEDPHSNLEPHFDLLGIE